MIKHPAGFSRQAKHYPENEKGPFMHRLLNPTARAKYISNSGMIKENTGAKGGKTMPSGSTDGTAPSRKPSHLVPAVDRALRILTRLKSKGCEMTLAEIARARGVIKAVFKSS